MLHFSYFNQDHIMSLWGILLLTVLVLALPFFSSRRRNQIAIILGLIIIISTILEILYRIACEGFSPAQAMPFHFCGLSLLTAGIYLLSRKDVCFQITYYYAFGALLALVLPGIDTYQYPLFFQLFMLNHMLVLVGCAYGMLWLGASPTLRGLRLSTGLALLLFPLAYWYNSIYFTNFMFMNAYIIPWAAFIKPFWLYQAGLALLTVLTMTGFYLPFRKSKETSRGDCRKRTMGGNFFLKKFPPKPPFKKL